MSVIIKVDDSMLKDVQKRLKEIPQKSPNAISASLNRTMTNVASNINKEIRSEYTVKAMDIRGTLKKTRANPSKLSAAVKSTGGVIGLDKFKTSALMTTSRKGGTKSVGFNRKPVKAAVKKGGMKTVLGAFVATVNGPKIFKRTTKRRLPIERLHGPSVPQMAGNDRIVEFVNTEAGATFEKRLDHEIGRLLERLGG